MSNIFISIQLNSNRPKNLIDLFNNLEKTTTQPSTIEVIVHFDLSDQETKDVLVYESNKRKLKIKYISTDLVKDYGDLWKPLNLILNETDNNAYFILNISDEIRFTTNGWDQELRKYINYYPDNIFRLRLSKYKYRNYFDFWECGFAPDSICFYTKKWMELSGDWNPCLGPDSFQQSVSYYLMTSDKFYSEQINRDIAINNINIIGEGAGKGNDELSYYKLILICTKAWFILMSHKSQEEAKRRAMRLKAEILSFKYKYTYIEDNNNRKFILVNNDGKYIKKLSYKLSKIYVNLINLYRIPGYLYYAGGGNEEKKLNLLAILFVIVCHKKNGEFAIYYYVRLKNLLKKLIEKLLKFSNIIFKIVDKNLISISNLFFKLITKKNKFFTNKFRKKLTEIYPTYLDIGNNNHLTYFPLISIHLATNKYKNLQELIKNIENTVTNVKNIELIIYIDSCDSQMISFLNTYKSSGILNVKYFASDLVTDFKFLYKAYNPLLYLTSKSVKFITLISDEIRFNTPGWDEIILSYSNYYQDKIFRIKLSKNKYFNYIDEWECGFAPDSLAFYSSDWLFLQDMWCPCTGPDSFQALVSYYMMKVNIFSHTQYYRDIVDPFLIFTGEGASVGLEGEAKRKRISDNNAEWFKLFSHKNMSIAKRNACILVIFIEYRKLKLENKYLNLRIFDDGSSLYLKDGNKIIFKVSYVLSKLIIIFKIITRAPFIHYYAGGGKSVIANNPLNGLRMMAMTYAPRLEFFLGGKIQ